MLQGMEWDFRLWKSGGHLSILDLNVLIATGGALYTLGVLFHSWELLRFQNAVWHGLVLVGAGCDFTAVIV